MAPSPRTPQQRDRRFARVRRLTGGILIGSGVSSAALVGIFATTAKPELAIHSTQPTTTTTTPLGTNGSSTTPSNDTPAAPTTTTTQPTCYTSPSGVQNCY